MKNYVIVLTSALLLMCAGCSRRQEAKISVRSVKADTARVYGQSQTVMFPGKIRAASDLNLAFRVSGPIIKVNANVGDYVRKGQILAEIDPRDYRIQLSATEAEYNRIKGESERVISLYEKQSVSSNDYDKAVYGLQQVTAQYNAHKNALADTKLIAPCDGYIQKRRFEPGETVSAGMPVISMINAGTPEVEINIPLSDYIKRDMFDSYSCNVDIYPDMTFPLDLIGISQKANMNQLYTMRLRLNSPGKILPGPGMTAMVTISYKPGDSPWVSVPLSSVFESAKGAAVWVYEQQSGSVTLRPVVLREILTDGTVIISEGVKAGETVVSAGVHSLEEGEKVRLLPAPSSTNVGGLL